MREVKVGQIWHWSSAAKDMSFEILKVSESTDNVEYQYSSNGITFSAPLTYFDTGVLVKDVKGSVKEENNQLSPNVYQFPNGVEVKDISAHLTSFGGQAVQYIARATRLDGVVKGLPVQDLYKAIELLKWEAERLEALQK